jgi:hypothetical protein
MRHKVIMAYCDRLQWCLDSNGGHIDVLYKWKVFFFVYLFFMMFSKNIRFSPWFVKKTEISKKFSCTDFIINPLFSFTCQKKTPKFCLHCCKGRFDRPEDHWEIVI